MTWMSGDEIYRNFQDGPGPRGLATSADHVNDLVGRYQGRVDRMLRLRARLEAAWEGSAADAADRGVAPLVIEHGLAGRALYVAQDLTSRQVGSFDEARNAVVPVPPVPGGVDALVMFTDPDSAGSYFTQVALHHEAAQHNVDVMNGYTGASRYNSDGQPTSYGQLADDLSGIGIEDEPRGETGGASVESDVDEARARDQQVSETGVDGGRAPEPDPVPGATFLPGTTEPAAESTRPPAMGATNTVPPNSVQTNTVPASAVPASGFGVPSFEAPEGGQRHGGLNGNVAGGSGAADGLFGGGRGGSATQPGTSVRPMVIAAGPGPGRGGVGFAGLPAPAGARREEDTERKTPAYLDGGDPEELWDTDELTAPPAIGDEDG